MKKILFLSFFIGLFYCSHAQELNVEVTINTPKLQSADPKVFQSLETALEEFMNNQKWTNDGFEDEERIKVEVIINISEERSATQFKGDLQIQSTRPVFGTNYETPLLNHQDKDFLFEYEQFQPVEYTPNQFNNNLTSVLSFYTYVILGLDYDSFSPYGGESHYQTAMEILNNIPPNAASIYKGWRSVDGNRNRYWVIENLLSPRVRDFRQAIYDYHRQGLDVMHKDMPTGRAIMTGAIQQIENVEKGYPRAMIIQMFANAKSNEIIEIYRGGSPDEKDKILTSMRRIHPSKQSAYRVIR